MQEIFDIGQELQQQRLIQAEMMAQRRHCLFRCGTGFRGQRIGGVAVRQPQQEEVDYHDRDNRRNRLPQRTSQRAKKAPHGLMPQASLLQQRQHPFPEQRQVRLEVVETQLDAIDPDILQPPDAIGNLFRRSNDLDLTPHRTIVGSIVDGAPRQACASPSNRPKPRGLVAGSA